jgi:hypothetical protein
MNGAPGEIAVIETTALEAISRAEIDIQISTAHRYPRAVSQCVDNMKALAILTPETAQEMTYVVPRGGKNISGPSVRLAEIAASSWNNMQAGSRIIEIGETFVVAQGVAHDLEKNYRYQHEVRRRITDKNGNRYSDDMIVITANAACAIAFREAIFHTVPRSIINTVWNAAQQVAIGQDKGFEARRNDAFAWFADQGADQKRVLAGLGRNDIGHVTPADVQTLHGIFQAIQTGETSIDEAMPAAASFSTDPPPPTGRSSNEDDKPEAPPPPIRRRRTRPILLEGKEVKSAGISGETADACLAAVRANAEGTSIARQYMQTELNLAQKEVTYLTEEEGRTLLSRLEPQPEEQLPAVFDGPPAQDAEVVPDTSLAPQNADLGDVPPNPAPNPWDEGQAIPEATQGAETTIFMGRIDASDGKILCANADGEVLLEKCESCPVREGCPSWDEVPNS